MAGSSATFGPGTYNFAGGYTMNGGSTNTFTGGGSYNFGPTASCNGSNYSICATSALSFTGSSTINLSNGLYVGGGTTVTMGSGSANTYDFGAAGSGAAIYLGGGAKLTMADATSGAFNLAGNFDAASGGGSCATFPAASLHNISGWFSTAGGAILGAGLYAIGGYFAAGDNGGGSVWCNNATVGVRGSGVTIAYAADSTPIGSTCNNDGVCFAAGFHYVNMTAPTSGAYAGLLFVGPQSNTTAGAMLTGGAGAVISGAFYLPTGAFNLGGGASIASPQGGCLEVVANTVTLAGGAAVASNCVASNNGPATPKFVE